MAQRGKMLFETCSERNEAYLANRYRAERTTSASGRNLTYYYDNKGDCVARIQKNKEKRYTISREEYKGGWVVIECAPEPEGNETTQTMSNINNKKVVITYQKTTMRVHINPDKDQPDTWEMRGLTLDVGSQQVMEEYTDESESDDGSDSEEEKTEPEIEPEPPEKQIPKAKRRKEETRIENEAHDTRATDKTTLMREQNVMLVTIKNGNDEIMLKVNEKHTLKKNIGICPNITIGAEQWRRLTVDEQDERKRKVLQ